MRIFLKFDIIFYGGATSTYMAHWKHAQMSDSCLRTNLFDPSFFTSNGVRKLAGKMPLAFHFKSLKPMQYKFAGKKGL